MATTYKEKAVGVEILTARLYADQIEVYPTHDLAECLRYQWKYNPVNGTTVDAPLDGSANPSSTNKEYHVDLDSVANSGDYYCEIQVGNTGDCDQITETRRITIVECVPGPSNPYTDKAGSGQAIVEAPHYEAVSAHTSDTFITLGSVVACTTPLPHVCRFVQPYTFTATSDKSEPRTGQIDITVGDYTCVHNLAQDRAPEEAAAPDKAEEPPASPGPFINLTNNGPSLALGGGFGTDITVTAEVGVVGGTIGSYEIDWSVSDFDSINEDGDVVTMTPVITPSADMLSAVVTNPGPIVLTEGGLGLPNPITVTAKVTDEDTGQTATTTQIADFYTLSFLFPDPPSVMGDTYGFVNWLDWGGNEGERTASGSFTTAGSGNWDASFTLLEGFIDTRSATLSWTLNGPGITETSGALTISGESEARENFSFTGLSGVYTWTITLSGVDPSHISRANGSALFNARFF